jgi:hypothetical protein
MHGLLVFYRAAACSATTTVTVDIIDGRSAWERWACNTSSAFALRAAR